MDITILSLFPTLYSEFLRTSIVGRSQVANLARIRVTSLMDYARPGERVDAPIAGHGAGMLIKPGIVEQAMQDAIPDLEKKPFVIFFSPHGSLLDQHKLHELHQKIQERNSQVVLFAGRYEGVDARVEEYYADQVLSIGNYVLMGGDLPAMVFIESLLRLVPGVVGDPGSVSEDSFESLYVDHPHYADPDVWKGVQIPPVLKSGNHKRIAEWREEQARDRTIKSNFQWLKAQLIPNAEKKKIVLPSHYCALMHNDVMLPDGVVGNSSVTSIDIHDVARSSATYGIKKYFVVSELVAQQKLVNHFLSFWQGEEGIEYNKSRARALKNVSLVAELSDVIREIVDIEGKEPVIIVTSSRDSESQAEMITYFDQERVWAANRPVLFLFGTAHGLNPALMDRCDFRLLPIEGFTDFNFLSVRSAAAIILDRWLGINPCYTKEKVL